jgi:hypothetical protein
MAKPIRDAEKEAFWRWAMQLHAESGLTGVAFCEREGLKLSSFYAWKRTLRERDDVEGREKRNGRSGRGKVAKGSAGSPKRSAGRAGRQTGSWPREGSATVPTLVPVEVISESSPAMEIVHPRGHVLRVPTAFSEDILRQVLKVLDTYTVAADTH